VRLYSHRRLYAGLSIATLCWLCLYASRNLGIRDAGDDVIATESTSLDDVILDSASEQLTENLGPLHCIFTGAVLLLIQARNVVPASPLVRVAVHQLFSADRYGRGPPSHLILR
jgi:hypothetical protein